MPHGLLARILHRDWLGHVAHNHRHRHTMRDLHGIEPALASLDSHKLSALDSMGLFSALPLMPSLIAATLAYVAAVMWLTMSGTASANAHCMPRHVLYAKAREPVQWAVGMFDILPDCLTHHLLVPTCPDLQQLRAVLHALPDEPVYSRVLVKQGCMQHLFTDGSCFFADTADFALASWAIVHANSSSVLGLGPLSGIQQTVPRAELQALVHAVRWVVQARVHATIWCDAKHVVDGFNELQTDQFLDGQKDNHDLCGQLWELTRPCGAGPTFRTSCFISCGPKQMRGCF